MTISLITPMSDNERIRSIILECWREQLDFPAAIQKLANAGFGFKEIAEYKIWAKNHPMPDAR